MGRTIQVLAAPAADTAAKTITSRTSTAVLATLEIDKLQAGLVDLRWAVVELFNAEVDESGFTLAQVSVGVELSADGGVTLIGTLKAGAKAAVTLTFERG